MFGLPVDRGMSIAFRPTILKWSDLHFRIIPVPRIGVIKACLGSFCPHGFGRFFKTNVNPELRLFSFQDTDQVTDVTDIKVLPALHRKDNLFGFARVVIMEVKPAINAVIRPFFLVNWSGTHQTQRPPLELLFILFRQVRAHLRYRFTNHFVFEFIAKGIFHAPFDQTNGKVSDIDPDPAPSQFLSSGNSRPAATERVQHHIAGLAGGVNDALKQCKGLLSGVTHAFGMPRS